jgi:hypothetical protein
MEGAGKVNGRGMKGGWKVDIRWVEGEWNVNGRIYLLYQTYTLYI